MNSTEISKTFYETEWFKSNQSQLINKRKKLLDLTKITKTSK